MSCPIPRFQKTSSGSSSMNNNELKILILRQARQYIEKRRISYICGAVNVASAKLMRRDKRSQHCGNQLRRYIIEKLDGSSWYTGWLSMHSAAYRELSGKECGEAARLGRLAWIDYMIRQLEAANVSVQ